MGGQIARTGHGSLYGMDGGTNPVSIPTSLCSLAVNRSFRNQKNRPRPAFKFVSLSFDSDQTKDIFENRAIKGVFEYKSASPNGVSCLIVFVGPLVCGIYISGSKASVVSLYNGLSQLTDVAAFVQVADRAYFQDGDGLRLGWDGVGDVYKLDDSQDSMPTFIAMAECQGRIIGFTETNYAIVSDHVYSLGAGSTKGAESWSEYQFFNDIGAIPFPSSLGTFVGATTIRQDAVFNAQGPLFVLGTKGSYMLDLQGVRSTWNIALIQKPYPMIQGGCSSDTLVSAGVDVWWQSDDGSLRSFKYAESDAERQWGGQSMSNEVQDFTGLSLVPALSHASSVVFGNRMLTTIGIRVGLDVVGNQHRYASGIVSLDFDRGTATTPDQGYSWDGLWTGLHPTKLCRLATRCYALDFNGKNRLFEITGDDTTDDLDSKGNPKKIESYYLTGMLLWDKDVSQPRYQKRVNSVSINAIAKPGSSLVCSIKGYSKPRQRLTIALTQGAGKPSAMPLNSLTPIASGPIHFGNSPDNSMDYAYSVGIHMAGEVQVDSMNLAATLEPDVVTANSQLTEGKLLGKEFIVEPFAYSLP